MQTENAINSKMKCPNFTNFFSNQKFLLQKRGNLCVWIFMFECNYLRNEKTKSKKEHHNAIIYKV